MSIPGTVMSNRDRSGTIKTISTSASAGLVDDLAFDSTFKIEEEVGRRFYLNANPDSAHTKNANMEPIVVGPPWMRRNPAWRCLCAPYLAILRNIERKKRRSRNPFIDNTVRTARYTVASFIPKQLAAQFSKIANVYFLFIVILQAIPDLSPTGRFTTIVPLSVFLIFSMAREAYDDYFRHKHDAAENNSPVRRLRVEHKGSKRRRSTRSENDHEMSIIESSAGHLNSMWEEVPCKALHVGDIVSVRDREFIPADLIVLATTNDNGTCFIETSNLDGETNLKLRQALKPTNDAITDLNSLADYQAVIHAEPPSGDLYNFDGYIVSGKTRTPLTVNQLIQRGATLRNTKKYLAPSCTAENKQGERHWYLAFLSYSAADYIRNFFSYIVLYNAFIPISLYVTLEVVKLMQVVWMNNDLAMYDAERDIPAEAHTSSLNEELGQVQYLFSDKTGTLTENIMEFRLFSVAGKRCRHFSVPDFEHSVHADTIISDLVQARSSGSRLSPELQQTFDFLEAVALCQSVVADPQEVKDQQGLSAVLRQSPSDLAIVYQASSADEVALLNAARDMKRMTVIYRYPNGRIVLLCKGADSMILERLQPDHLITRDQAAVNAKTTDDISVFASKGLRTLLYSYRILEQSEYEAWAAKYADASSALQNRVQRMAEVAEEIEQNLMLLGATAIEDRLQDGVPETIEKLRRAGIKVWMLTGDKTETAINIGHTCSIIRPDSTVLVVKEEGGGGLASIERSLEEAIDMFRRIKVGKGGDEMYKETKTHVVAVIEGGTLTKIEKQHAKLINDSNTTLSSSKSSSTVSILNRFLDLAMASDTLDKEISGGGPSASQRFWASLTLEPKPSGVTLAIGDGANDIPMIESAHVGIGITGREGLAASRSADYAIAKFRFLQNVAFYGTQIVFQYWTGASGTSLYEQWTLASNNLLFTSLPVVVVGILEKDLNRSTLMAVPELYRFGQMNQGLNFRLFIKWMMQGGLHAILAVVVPAIYYGGFWTKGPDVLKMNLPPDLTDSMNWTRNLLMSDGSGQFQETGLFAFGILPYTISIIFCTVKILYTESHTWTWVHHLVAGLTFALWILWNIIYSYIWPYLGYDNAPEFFGFMVAARACPATVWTIAVVTAVIGLMFVEYWVNAMGWLNRLRHWGKRGGRDEAGVAVNEDKVRRFVEVERLGSKGGMSLKALRYQMAREDAAVAAANAVGEHDWGKEVKWWQVWERRHGITSDLCEED
ncbi:hypothetical protein BC829DRAFT_420794 [Chytridium lagenaria]|nr:hypothetical protein BC829DRAFT_420794 [Chytridium lagenaria]